MRIFILLIFVLTIPRAMATLYMSPGGMLSGEIKSDSKASNSRHIYESTSGFGLEIQFEKTMFWGLGIVLGARYSTHAGKSEYSFFNPDNGQSAQVSELDTSMGMLGGVAGVRWRLINAGALGLFIGGGHIFGNATLIHNKDDFMQKQNNSEVGYRYSSAASYSGRFYEVALNYFWNKKNGFTILGRENSLKTKSFETLGNASFRSKFLDIGFFYNHIVDLSFFWK